MFYSEALFSCQFASILGSYVILHYWALVLVLYFGFPVLFYPEYQHPIHIYYIKHENAFTCKRICWYLGGNNVEKIFFYLLYVYYRKRLFQPKNKVVHLFKIENWIQYHKIGTNSKLIHEDRSI